MEPAIKKSNRDEGIECLRGVAIILVVMGHVVGGTPEYGLKLPEQSTYRYFFHDWFAHIRMPLFTVISGYVYAMRPITTMGHVPRFVVRKCRRLLIPFFIAAVAFFLSQSLVAGLGIKEILPSIWTVFFHSHIVYWFIQGVFLTFIIVAILEGLRLLDRFRSWAVVFLLAIALYYSDLDLPDWFALNRVPFLLAFFLLGLGLKRFDPYLLGSKRFIRMVCISFLVLFVIEQYAYFSYAYIPPYVARLFTIMIGSTATFLLITYRFKNRLLSTIGNYSYEIFLYHVFGIVIMRLMLQAAGIYHPAIHLPFQLLLGLSLPLAIKWLVAKSPKINLIVFGDPIKKALRL